MWSERSTKLALLGVYGIFTVVIGLYIWKVGSLTDQQYQLVGSGDSVVFAAYEPPIPGYTFPKGGTTLLPDYRLVALYGSPDIPALGALGAQDKDAAIARVKALAAEYQTLTSETVLPTLEIITTIASSQPTDNGDYSQEIDIAKIKPWVDAAKTSGVYVILDLQPGRIDFLTQAKQYEDLLKEPHVGLALDAEWRIKPDQVHLKQIGSVDAGEINQVSSWLADLVSAHALPQKALLLHQFKQSMITNRDQINTTRTELAYIIQMDGQGNPSVKKDTWNVLLANPPANTFYGWKNFYQKDTPMMTSTETMQLAPVPWYVSYQ